MTTLALPDPRPLQFTAPQMSWPRVGALSGTLSLYLLAAALLLIPPAAVTLLRPATQTILVDWIDPPPKPIEVPPPPIPVPIVHHEKQKVKPLPAPEAPHVDVVADSPFPTPVDHAPPAPDTGTAAPADTAPSPLGYLTRTPVKYPREALQRREQGTVILRVLVGADGKPQSVEIEKSSGSRSLDQAARAAVEHWTFRPGTLNGVRSALWALVPIAFDLRQL